MLLFCPSCGNGLIVEEGQRCHRFACNTCPYVHNITRKVTNRKYPKLKEVDDVLGGAAAWENVNIPVPISCSFRPVLQMSR
ncbi:DNA-directed RNA polymerase III subunit RPC10 [Lemmus lemmus]